MEIEFFLAVPPFSTNAYYYASKKIKTKEAREWEERVKRELEDVKDLQDIADYWNENGGTFHVEYRVTYPFRVYYNAARTISSKSLDVSNVEKHLQDLIFNHMGINDKYVTSMYSSKRPGVAYEIAVKLKLNRYEPEDAA